MKKHWFSFFGNQGGKNGKGQNLPWLSTPSIYAHIVRHLDPVSGRLKESGMALPDEERRYADTQLRWAPGAMDGAFGRHFGANTNEDLAHTIAGHITKIAQTASEPDKIALYSLLLDDNLLDFIDLALQEMMQADISPYPHLHSFAAFLAREAPDRGPVKFAIALLGVMGNQSDTEAISIVGRHEEFTLYAAVALTNMLPEPEPELWQLAQKVDGWGRIQLVERLSETSSPQIKEWLLLEGYRNSIMYEYLAYTCATAGDLKTALCPEIVEDTLLDAAGEIIEALISGGPAEDINDYADAADVVVCYLNHVQGRTAKIEQFVVVDSIARYLSDDDWNSQERAQNGWTDAARASMIETARQILDHPQWPPLVQHALSSSDNREFHLADRAATTLGIDTWAAHWSRLKERPREGYLWFPVMQRANPDNIDMIIQLAIDSLPLDQIGTGPADALGLGSEYMIHLCLDAIVQGLGAYPAKGWPLLATCLKSPVISQRNMALRAIAQWGKHHWTSDIERALIEAQAIEPQPDVKQRIGKVLRGEAFDEADPSAFQA